MKMNLNKDLPPVPLESCQDRYEEHPRTGTWPIPNVDLRQYVNNAHEASALLQGQGQRIHDEGGE